MKQELLKAQKVLDEITKARDEYEIEYELEKARMIFSAEVQAMSNQTMRDAQTNILLEEKGMYRKMAELKSKARRAYYEWATFKSLMEGNR